MRAVLPADGRGGGLYAQLYVEQFGGGAVEARCADRVLFSDGKVLARRASTDPNAA